jgi:hypothetical protein
MRLDRIGPSAAEAPPPPVGKDSPSEMERLRAECRRRAMQIDTLRDYVASPSEEAAAERTAIPAVRDSISGSGRRRFD